MSFEKDELFSRRAIPEEDLLWFYRRYFSRRVVRAERTEDTHLQKAGVDTLVYLETDKVVYCDEKIRRKKYGDVLLEECSVWPNHPWLTQSGGTATKVGRKEPLTSELTDWDDRLEPGWLWDESKITDLIVYAVYHEDQHDPYDPVRFLPFELLREAWLAHYATWVRRYGRRWSKNEGYTTTFVCVPWGALQAVLYDGRQR